MCKACEETSCLISSHIDYDDNNRIFTRLRFDLENNQLDMQFGMRNNETDEGPSDWSDSVDIEFCPFCGNRLPINVSRLDMLALISSLRSVCGDTSEDARGRLVTMILATPNNDNSLITNNELLTVLGEHYGDSVDKIKRFPYDPDTFIIYFNSNKNSKKDEVK